MTNLKSIIYYDMSATEMFVAKELRGCGRKP